MVQLSELSYTARGDILSTNCETLREEFMSMVRQAPAGSAVSFDLRVTRLIDSAGLNLLVSAIKAAQNRNVRVRIHVAHANVARILTFTRLNQHAEITQSAV